MRLVLTVVSPGEQRAADVVLEADPATPVVRIAAAELVGVLAAFTRPGVVLIDDAELLRDCRAAGELSRLIAFGGDDGRALILGGDAERSAWDSAAGRSRRGGRGAAS